jgi:thiol-disulfide isomerase/thioredoxin
MKKNILSAIFISLIAFSFAQTTQRLSPDFEAITLDGDTMSLSDILLNQQKYVALEFFFNESIQCMETSPLVTEAYENLGQNQTDVIFISINVNNDSTQCRNYMDSLGLETPIIAGTKGGNEIVDAYDIQSFPSLILISPSIPDTLIAQDSILTDTTINGNDTTLVEYYDYQYNIVESDIWPINTADDIISVLTSYHGITGIDDPYEKKEQTLFLYPNPSKGLINIQSDYISGPIKYHVYDLSGKVIYSDDTILPKQEKISIDLSWLKRGVYIIRIFNEQNELNQKLIIH